MIIQKTLRTVLVAGALGVALAAQGQNPVTFQVDMTSQPGATDVYIRGSFNNWGNAPQSPTPLTNNGSGVYTGVVDIAASPGSVQACKFFYQPGDTWESISDRQFILAGGAQTMPLTAWNVSDWPVPVNKIKFQVDMSAQVVLGAFNGGYVRVSGNFNTWNSSIDFTNDPSAVDLATNIYSQTLEIAGFPGSSPGEYKFRAPIGNTYETINNRPSFQIAGGDQTLPLVFWDNASTCDLLLADTTVTFALHMTNGTVARDGYVFNSATDKLHINGAFLGWWAWFDGVTSGANSSNELTNSPGNPDLYQQSFTVAKGTSLAMPYKFSINGVENELPPFVNRVRYIRTSSGGAYAMPVDSFMTNNTPPIEISFGDLVVSSGSGGNVPIGWLGRQCVTLQTRANLSTGLWQDIPATDATSSTNWPAGPGSAFFRLQKRNNP